MVSKEASLCASSTGGGRAVHRERGRDAVQRGRRRPLRVREERDQGPVRGLVVTEQVPRRFGQSLQDPRWLRGRVPRFVPFFSLERGPVGPTRLDGTGGTSGDSRRPKQIVSVSWVLEQPSRREGLSSPLRLWRDSAKCTPGSHRPSVLAWLIGMGPRWMGS